MGLLRGAEGLFDKACLVFTSNFDVDLHLVLFWITGPSIHVWKNHFRFWGRAAGLLEERRGLKKIAGAPIPSTRQTISYVI